MDSRWLPDDWLSRRRRTPIPSPLKMDDENAVTDQEIVELDEFAGRLLRLPVRALERHLPVIESHIGRLMDAGHAEPIQARKMRLVAIESKLRLQRERLLVQQRN